MGSVTVITKLAGKESSIATQDTESLHRLFRSMQVEALQTPPTESAHRLFVHIYTYPAKEADRKAPTA
jgi:hypothetical protein